MIESRRSLGVSFIEVFGDTNVGFTYLQGYELQRGYPEAAQRKVTSACKIFTEK